MSEAPQNTQQPPQAPPAGYYPPPYGWYAPPAPQAERPLDKLTWKQKIIVVAALAVILLTFGMWNSCHTQTQQISQAAKVQQQPTFLPPNPQTIESQREAAERELAKAKAEAEAAKQRLQNGSTLPDGEGNSAQARAGPSGSGQNPDVDFWRQVRQEKWKREQEAPYASGVGFVTRAPKESSAQTPAEAANLVGQIPNYYPPRPYAQQPQQQIPSAEKRQTEQQAASGKGPLPWNENEATEANEHPIRVGTIIPATLLNQLEGEFTGPIICQVSKDVYDDLGTTLRIPAGSKVLGEAHPVSSNNQRRLAVSFHKLLIKGQPDISLDKLPGLDQTGASALSGKVDNHYLQTFGMAMAVGAFAGLAQIGNAGASAIYSPWYGFRQGVSQQTAMSGEQILERYLNRYPTVTIRPGTRVKIILLADL